MRRFGWKGGALAAVVALLLGFAINLPTQLATMVWEAM